MLGQVCPVILAAGQSTRFGSDKLRYSIKYKGSVQPIIIHTLTSWLAVFKTINIVIREDNVGLVQLLDEYEHRHRLRLIPAINPERGMSASLMTGVRANQEALGWLIGLADMPFIDESVLGESKLALENGAVITQSEFNGMRGHPVGFSASNLSEILALEGDKGAKKKSFNHHQSTFMSC
jgi:molybdenum cofactor cytidylyltransferase